VNKTPVEGSMESEVVAQPYMLRASAARMLNSTTDSVDPLSPQGIWLSLNELMPAWAVWVTLLGGTFLICCAIALCSCCVLARRRKSATRRSNKSSLSKYNNQNGNSARTMARKLDGTPSRALRMFKSKDTKPQPGSFVRMSDASDDVEVSPRLRPVSKRIPESYGRVDEETAKRIQSIRQSVNLKPILAQQQAPNAKALRMMGITHEESTRKFDETVQERMKRVAAGAGGGVYAPGFATAGFGSSVVEGFATLRAKKEKKAAAKRLTQSTQPEFQRVKLKPTNTSSSASTAASSTALQPAAPKLSQFLARKDSEGSGSNASKESASSSNDKPRAPTKSVYGPKVDGLKPGGNKLAAFLSTTAAAPATLEDDGDDNYDDDDKSDSGTSDAGSMDDIDDVL
jgi:hypothetical protein